MSDTVLRKLWMDKLSPQTSQILVSLPDDLDLQRLAEIADKIYENKPPGNASATPLQPIVSSVRDSQELSKIKDCIAELTSQLQALQTAMHQQNRTPNNFTSRPRPSHHTSRRSRSTSRSRPIFNTCWYYFKYGQQARHCTKPCNFDINAAKDNKHSSRETTIPATSRDVCCRRDAKSRLFYIRDENSGYLFLVDTGAQISVIPAKPNMLNRKTDYTLQAANGSSIQTYGETSLTLNLGFRRSFPWVFTIAQVRTPILGADFLAHFNLFVNMSSLSLEDKTTNITRK
ncbi:unnamed protein product [Acanthosepion pharaonis]|uniref:Peptidase A2 domain-containing protein n=1 Tax=Acanthosepion pharaonis TaxID=158019 RepID=A0A812E096_ACAPH|nr:unnamed protein product [Sepia pharaonis]